MEEERECRQFSHCLRRAERKDSKICCRESTTKSGLGAEVGEEEHEAFSELKVLILHARRASREFYARSNGNIFFYAACNLPLYDSRIIIDRGDLSDTILLSFRCSFCNHWFLSQDSEFVDLKFFDWHFIKKFCNALNCKQWLRIFLNELKLYFMRKTTIMC